MFCKLGNGTVRDLTLDTNTIYTHPAAIQCNAAAEINSLKSSVSSGKTQVANAITGKGVSASGNDSFATLASKINQIPTETFGGLHSSYNGWRIFPNANINTYPIDGVWGFTHRYHTAVLAPLPYQDNLDSSLADVRYSVRFISPDLSASGYKSLKCILLSHYDGRPLHADTFATVQYTDGTTEQTRFYEQWNEPQRVQFGGKTIRYFYIDMVTQRDVVSSVPGLAIPDNNNGFMILANLLFVYRVEAGTTTSNLSPIYTTTNPAFARFFERV